MYSAASRHRIVPAFGAMVAVIMAALFLSRPAWSAPPAAPEGWQTGAPRDEIRPAFSYRADGGPDGTGGFLIDADAREGLHGWWQKSFAVQGGRNYRFSVLRRVEHLPNPRRSVVVRVLWQDDQGRPVPLDEPIVTDYLIGWKGNAEPEYPYDRATDAKGWTEVSGNYRAPAK